MGKSPFRSFGGSKADRSTFKPRGETKQRFVDRVHGSVMESDSIGHLWNVYYQNRFANRTNRPLEPDHIELLKSVFYAGVASMFQLMNKAADVGDSEDDIERGAARMQRLYEELDTYVRSLD